MDNGGKDEERKRRGRRFLHSIPFHIHEIKEYRKREAKVRWSII